MPSRALAVRLLLLGVFIGLCGGMACSDGKAHPGYTKIDDMEHGGYLVEWAPPPGMVPGIWAAATDCTEGGNISPPSYFIDPLGWSFAELPAPYQTFTGGLSTHAAHLRTTAPLIGVWGAEMGFDFAEMPNADGGEVWPPPDFDAAASPPGSTCRQPQNTDFDGGTVDLSAYSGITFWAKADPAGATSLVVEFQDENNDPRGGVCNAANPSDTSDCYNQFTVTIPLSATFTQYTVDFSRLQQDSGWGNHPEPDVVDLHHVYGLAFAMNAWTCPSDSMCLGGSPPGGDLRSLGR
jgi:hypothetical protein